MNQMHQVMLYPEYQEPSSSSQEIFKKEININNVPDSELSSTCRLCTAVYENLVPLYEGEGLQNKLADKINEYLPITVSEEDTLPLSICYQCMNTVVAWSDLVQCCVQADAALRARAPNVTNVQETSIQYLDNGDSEDKYDKARSVTLDAAGRRRARCPCGAVVAAGNWRRHARSHAGARHPCAACGRVFTDAGNLARHTRALHAGARPHVCACGKRFSRADHLRDHQRTHAPNRAFLCEVCGAALVTAAALRVHRAGHAGRHACACGASFPRASQLRAHAARAHPAPEHRPVVLTVTNHTTACDS